jgi:hypothetical protein
MNYLPFQIAVPLACGLGIVYLVLFLLSAVNGKRMHGIAWTIVFSSLNIGFGVDLLLLVMGIGNNSDPSLVQGYGVALVLGSFAMLVTALRDLAKLFRLETRILQLRRSLRHLMNRTPIFCCA